MWVIGMVICAAFMLAGHAVTNAGHGSHAHEHAAARQVEPAVIAPEATPPAPSGAHERRENEE
jgi:hypothetical protein